MVSASAVARSVIEISYITISVWSPVWILHAFFVTKRQDFQEIAATNGTGMSYT